MVTHAHTLRFHVNTHTLANTRTLKHTHAHAHKHTHTYSHTNRHAQIAIVVRPNGKVE